MRLIDGEKGFIYEVEKINLDKNVKRRLEAIGMTENSRVFILNKKRNGAIIVKIRGTRFALGKKFAEGVEIGGALN